ncbi:hypothetical protein BGP_0505 [Beggiatoa sp. PS]|nr:hypothetical protein BGP_0505 [Beggiatoa sp. PS]
MLIVNEKITTTYCFLWMEQKRNPLILLCHILTQRRKDAKFKPLNHFAFLAALREN